MDIKIEREQEEVVNEEEDTNFDKLILKS